MHVMNEYTAEEGVAKSLQISCGKSCGLFCRPMLTSHRKPSARPPQALEHPAMCKPSVSATVCSANAVQVLTVGMEKQT